MDIPALTEQLSKLVEGSPEGLPEEQRLALVEALTKARSAVSSPLEKMIDLLLAPHDAIAARLAVDMGLMDIALTHGGPVTASTLAEKSKADIELVRRIMRFMTGMSFFKEDDTDLYTPLPTGLTFLAPGSPLRECVIHLVDGYPATASMPTFFKKTAWRNPNDAYNGPWQHAYRTPGQHFFEQLDERSAHALSVVMSLQPRGTGTQWYDVWPTEEKLKVDDADRAVFVDVAGGVGHETKAFAERFPSLPGKIFLTDLPQVLVSVPSTLPSSITLVPHDFFKTPFPAPLQGAKAYYMRAVLHDWPDTQARSILSNIRNVMADDSLLLINEVVLPEKGTTLWHARQDFQMMAYCASGERTERQWRGLVQSAGFEVVKIVEGKETALIECVKKV